MHFRATCSAADFGRATGVLGVFAEPRLRRETRCFRRGTDRDVAKQRKRFSRCYPGDSTLRYDQEHYTLELADEDGKNQYRGNLVQLGSRRFLDVVRSGTFSAEGKFRADPEPGYIPTHIILEVIVEGDSLFLMGPHDEWLCQAV